MEQKVLNQLMTFENEQNKKMVGSWYETKHTVMV